MFKQKPLEAGPGAEQLLFPSVGCSFSGPPWAAPGAAAPRAARGASVAALPPSPGWCGHRRGALGATGGAPAGTSSVSQAQPLGSPGHVPGTRCSGRHGGDQRWLLAEHPGRPTGATEREGTALLAAFSARFTLCAGDGGGTWYIDLKTKGGSAGFGKPPVTADVVMSMSSADFVKMFTGEGQRPLSGDAGTGAQESLC